LRATGSTPGANRAWRKQCGPATNSPFLLFLWTVWLFLLPLASGQDSQLSEYKVKAAFLFNFTKFVEWPPESFARPDAPLVIGVFGENPFGADLEAMIHNKTVNNRSLETRQFRSPAECTNCHVLFVGAAEKGRLKEILEKLRNSSVLTVSETDGFTEAGGMINFVRDGTKFRFQINNDAAKKANLKISSKMLGLAVPSSH
jgi:hypothetical protein